MLADILVAAAAWMIAILKFDAARRRWNADHRLLYSWSGIVFFASGVTLQIDTIYQDVDNLTGIPNLSWFLIDVSLFLALYCGSIFAYAVAEKPTPRWIRFVLIVASGMHLLIFLAGIALGPEITWSEHRVETLHSFVFMETENVYGTIMGTVMATVFGHLFRSEQHPLTRLRWGLLCILATLGTTIYLLYALQCLGDISPAFQFLDGLGALAGGVRWAVGLLWPLAIVPNRVYLTMLSPFAFASKLRTLGKLNRARVKVEYLKKVTCPGAAITAYHPTLRDALADLDFHVYRTVIAILDATRSLKLSSPHAQQKYPGIVSIVQMLDHTLGDISGDQADYEKLIARYLKAGKLLQESEFQNQPGRP